MRFVALLRRNGILFLKRIWISALLCGLFAAGCLLAANALSGRNSEHYTPMRVAVVNNDNGDMAKLAVNLLTNSDHSFKEVITLETMDGDTAMSLLEKGEIIGAVVIPEGAIDGYLYGENIPVTILTSKASPYESLLMQQIGDVGRTVLSSGRSGTYTVQRIMIEQKQTENYDDVSNKINLTLIGKSLGAYTDMTEWSTINLSGALLPLLPHHILCFISFFMLCSGAFNAKFISTDFDASMLKRLKCCNVSSVRFTASKAVFLLLFNIVLLYVLFGAAENFANTDIHPAFIEIFATALFTTSITLFMFYTFGERNAIFILSLISVCGLILGGGIIPSVLMPDILSSVGGLFPNRLCYNVLSSAFGADGSPLCIALMLILSAAMLAVSCMAVSRKSHKEEAGNI